MMLDMRSVFWIFQAQFVISHMICFGQCSVCALEEMYSDAAARLNVLNSSGSFGLKYTAAPWTMREFGGGEGVQLSLAIKYIKKYVSLQLALYVHGSTTIDLTNHGLWSIVICIHFFKKSTYKVAQVVQNSVVQGSIVLQVQYFCIDFQYILTDFQCFVTDFLLMIYPLLKAGCWIYYCCIVLYFSLHVF